MFQYHYASEILCNVGKVYIFYSLCTLPTADSWYRKPPPRVGLHGYLSSLQRRVRHLLQNVKGQKFACYLTRSKCPFFLFSSKTKYRYMCRPKFLFLKLIFAIICYSSHAFFGFCAITFIDDETQFFLFKAVFLIIIDFQIC